MAASRTPSFEDRLRANAAVHPGIVHELTGMEGDAFFHGLPYPDRPHFSAFSFEACDAVYRDPEVFASSPAPVEITFEEPSAQGYASLASGCCGREKTSRSYQTESSR